MATFQEHYDDLTDFDFGTSPTTNLVLASTSPAPYIGASRSTMIENTTAWGAAVFDLVDGGVAANTYWISYAIYIDSWAPIFASSFKDAWLPGFINANDDPLKGATNTSNVIWLGPYLEATSSAAGKIHSNGLGGAGTSISAGAWHTVRYGLKLNGASSTEELWLDNTMVESGSVNYSTLPGGGATGLWGICLFSYGDSNGGTVSIYHDSLVYDSTGDPGEPVETGGTGADTAESSPTPEITGGGGGGGGGLHWVKVLPDSSASIELDTDPTFSNAVPEAWWSVLVYIPSTAQTYLTANSPSPGPVVQADGGGICIKHITGTTYEWVYHVGHVSTGAPVIFDDWFQLEWHVVAGSHVIDFWINGTHYSFTKGGAAVAGANFFNAGSYAYGAGSPVDADDWIGYDELSSSTTGQISLGSAYYLWSLEDTVDPLGDSQTAYPDPPFYAYTLARLSLETPGGGPAGCDTIASVSPCGGSDPDPPGGPGAPAPGSGAGSGYYSFQVFLDGVDITACALQGSWTPRLNRPAQAQIKTPMDCVTAGVGSRLKILLNGNIVFHGMVLLCETDCDENFGYTTYNAQDPMELWSSRPVRDQTGNFSQPDINNLLGSTPTGSEMMQAILTNTVSAGGGPPSDAEGDIFLTMGAFETGGANLTGAPVDWPMTIAEFASLLISTGTVDVVITPTDPGGGVMGTVSGYNGDYGTDRSSTVLFQYGTGAYNVSALRWNEDMSTMCNKLWYYAGPRCGTAADPAGNEHWCYNITGTDSLLPDPIPNGATRGAIPGPAAPGTLLGIRDDSRTTYGVRMDIQIFDAVDDDCCGNAIGSPGRDLYRNRWEIESWIRQTPRTLVHITPTPGFEIGSFDIGDLVHVEATSAVRGGFSGAQRVYSYTVSWDENSVLALSELQTSDTGDA